jgi:mitochondrial translocator assembly and maintenance protein 41
MTTTTPPPEEQGVLANRAKLTSLLEHGFPREEIVHAFAYGSGVFDQGRTSEQSDAWTDLILVVRDAYQFHARNRIQNPSHYRAVPRRLFHRPNDAVASYVTYWQQESHAAWMRPWTTDPGFWFTLVHHDEISNIGGGGLKYGVIERGHDAKLSCAAADLRHWHYLYLAGRLQKPVLTLINDNDSTASISYLQQTFNLPAAMALSLLLLPSLPSEAEVYQTVAGLSYTGDIRMQYGAEDPRKISNLVQFSSLERFWHLYHPVVQPWIEQGFLQLPNGDISWQWDHKSVAARQVLWQTLPASFQQRVCQIQPNEFATSVQESIQTQQQELRQALASIVTPATRYQTMKGIISTGIVQSIKYAARKFAKGRLR